MEQQVGSAVKFVEIFGARIPELNLIVHPLNISAFVYLAACILYFFAVAKVGSKAEKFWYRFSSKVFVCAWIFHTLGLLGRWYVGGISRPPWTNLYESLVAFAWMLASFQVYSLWKWAAPLVGAIASPLIFLLMGMSVMTPNKSVEPLIPALQSYWLKIHVVFGMISYAGFTMAACFGFLHLFKNKVSLSKIGAGLCALLLLNLGIAGGVEVWKTGQFFMTKTVARVLTDGSMHMVADRAPEYPGGPMITRLEAVPYGGVFYFLAVAGFLSAAILFLLRRTRKSEARDLAPLSWRVFLMSLIFLLSLCVTIGMGVRNSPTLTLASNPYLVQLLLISFFFAGLFVLVVQRYQGFLKALPSATRLDELGYKNILFAFPFQTLLLVTGAIWAKYAWSRSWGWDPKETWALITWFVYLIYLHGKLLMGWKPNLLSVVAIIGFMVMVFAFLGVNLVLSGLHSYGAA